MTRLDELLYEMTRYDDKDVKRIQHFLKVHEFARLIGFEENLDPYTQKSVFERIFRTEGGKRLFRLMFESGEE